MLHIKQIIESIRLWLLKSLFTEDEKYLIARAIDHRKDAMVGDSIKDKYADKHNIYQDYRDYNKIRKIFSTENWE